MQNVLLVVHLIACISLVFAVLLQRSEGGALGMGGGGTGGLISGRGAANVLVKTTMGLAAVFFTTSVLMTRLNAEQARAPTELERQLQEQSTDPFSTPTTQAPGTSTTPPTATTPPATNTPDPLAPSTPPASTPAPAPSGTTTPPAQSTTPAQPAPAPAQPTPAPTQPAPAQDPLAPAQNQ
jgi:preprotein translocase subunit SecG